MADSINIVDPYENYDPYSQDNIENYGDDQLDRVSSLQVGFGSKVLRVDRDGLWLGSDLFADAPFKVDMQGNMTATTLDLSSYLQVGDALADVQSDIFDLADIDTDLGVIFAGTLIGVEVRGSLIRTSTSGDRVEIDDSTNNIEIYDSSGTKRMELDQDEMVFYNSSGFDIGYITTPTTTNFYVGATTGNFLVLEAESSAYSVIIRTGGVIRTSFAAGGIDVHDNDITNCSRIEGNGNELDFGTSSFRIYCNDDFEPSSDNAHDLGGPSEIWNDIYVSDVHYDTLTLMSDRNQKENIVPTQYGLAEILALQPVNFNYKQKELEETEPKLVDQKIRNKKKYNHIVQKTKKNLKARSDRKHIGFIAQDVAPVMPELVRQNQEGTYVLQHTEIIAVLVKAIQEQQEVIDALVAKVNP